MEQNATGNLSRNEDTRKFLDSFFHSTRYNEESREKRENDEQNRLSSMTDQSDQTEHLLSKLRQVFKDGYRPARGTESYNVKLANDVKAYTMVNCLGHIFNLQNQQFNDYKFKPYKMFGYFPRLGLNSNDKAADRMFDFIKETGLQIEECAPDKPIEDFKSWKIALYFEDNKWHRDFHYLLEDAPQRWSSKVGFKPYVEHIYETMPPLMYHNLVDTYPVNYQFYGTYKITNPNADTNNRYLKHFTIRPQANVLKSLPEQHYPSADERKDNIEGIIDELLVK